MCHYLLVRSAFDQHIYCVKIFQKLQLLLNAEVTTFYILTNFLAPRTWFQFDAESISFPQRSVFAYIQHRDCHNKFFLGRHEAHVKFCNLDPGRNPYQKSCRGHRRLVRIQKS